MGRREDKRELTRQQMLDAARRVLFIERGYENTSLEDISEKANVSKGTFYYHFESKEDLVVHLRRSLVKTLSIMPSISCTRGNRRSQPWRNSCSIRP